MKKIFYGFTELGINAVEVFLRLHLLVFYSKDIGLDPFLTGLALAISIFWDAAIDPWIGQFSDRQKNIKGTRIHLMIFGAVFTSFFLFLVFHPPAWLVLSWQKWLYLLVTTLFLNTSYTFLSIPYTAMVGDYSSDRQQRSQYIAWRMVFANFGAILGIAIPGYFLVHDPTHAYNYSSLFIALCVIVSALTPRLFPPPVKKETHAAQEQAGFQFKHLVKNMPFVVLLFAYFILNVALTFNSAAALYYYRMRLHLSESVIENVLLIFLVVFCLGIPGWLYLAKKIGRKYSMMIGSIGLGVHACFVYLWLPIDNPMSVYIYASFIGGVLVGSSVLMESTLTDVIDYDTVKTRKENFGLYFGLWKFSSKFSRAFALLLTGSLLSWAHVQAPDENSPLRVAIIFGPVVGVFFIIAGLAILSFGLSEERCLKVKRILEKRKSINP